MMVIAPIHFGRTQASSNLSTDTPYGRFYSIDGSWRVSITTILKAGMPASHGLMQWLKAQPDAETADRLRDQAAERGTLVHSLVEILIKEGQVNVEGQSKEVIDMVTGAASWLEANCAQVEATEVILHDNQVAGRADLKCILKDGRRAVVDYKTSKSLHASHEIQVAKYAQLAGCEAAILVQLKSAPKNKFFAKEVKDLARHVEAFDHAYWWYVYLGGRLEPLPEMELPKLITLKESK